MSVEHTLNIKKTTTVLRTIPCKNVCHAVITQAQLCFTKALQIAPNIYMRHNLTGPRSMPLLVYTEITGFRKAEGLSLLDLMVCVGKVGN